MLMIATKLYTKFQPAKPSGKFLVLLALFHVLIFTYNNIFIISKKQSIGETNISNIICFARDKYVTSV